MVGNIVPSAIHSDVGTFSNVFLALNGLRPGGTEAANVLRSCEVIEFSKHMADDYAELASEQNRLRRVIRSIVFCGAATADILQRVNLIAWEKQKEFEQGTNFRNWINAIVR